MLAFAGVLWTNPFGVDACMILALPRSSSSSSKKASSGERNVTLERARRAVSLDGGNLLKLGNMVAVAGALSLWGQRPPRHLFFVGRWRFRPSRIGIKGDGDSPLLLQAGGSYLR